MEALDFKGWYEVEFNNASTKLINLDHAVYDLNGYVMYLVDHDKRHYNFNCVRSFMKKETPDGG